MMNEKRSLQRGNERTRSKTLDDCLWQIQSGQETVEDCLRKHPDLGEEIHQALRLAQLAERTLASSAPAEAIRDRVGARVFHRLREDTGAARPVARRIPQGRVRGWRPAFALTSLAVILGLLGLTTGAAFASTEALPGDLLYPVKHGLEQVRLALTWTPQGQAALLADLADERLSEAETLVAVGRLPDVATALRGYEDEITALIGLAAQVPQDQGAGSLQDLDDRLSHHLDVLETVRGRVPVAAQGVVEEALARAGQGQAVVEQVRAGRKPSELAPGQQERPTDQPHGNPQGDRGHGGGGQAGGPNDNRGGGSARATPSPTMAE